MRGLGIVALLCSLAFPPLACANDIAPGSTLRAVYLGSNPAQAVQDRFTGAIRGVSADLARECAEARDMGFDGKTLIHPNQIGPCNAAFSPSAEEVAHARKIIAAFNLPENKDKGVVQLDGRMVERLHADMAKRTVAIARAIEERDLEGQPAG